MLVIWKCIFLDYCDKNFDFTVTKFSFLGSVGAYYSKKDFLLKTLFIGHV